MTADRSTLCWAGLVCNVRHTSASALSVSVIRFVGGWARCACLGATLSDHRLSLARGHALLSSGAHAGARPLQRRGRCVGGDGRRRADRTARRHRRRPHHKPHRHAHDGGDDDGGSSSARLQSVPDNVQELYDRSEHGCSGGVVLDSQSGGFHAAGRPNAHCASAMRSIALTPQTFVARHCRLLTRAVRRQEVQAQSGHPDGQHGRSAF